MARCLVLIIIVEMLARTCCLNITIGVLVERSDILDFPFSINRTKGLIDIAINKTRDIIQDRANLDYVIVPCDVPTCVASKWGALFSEMYHKYRPHAVIGPGKEIPFSFRKYYSIIQ